MKKERKPRNYWTKEKCAEAALLYHTKRELERNRSVYSRIIKNNWWDELCSHIVSTNNPRNYWTYEKCNEESLKYNTKKQFSNGSATAYGVAIKNKWIDKICLHMVNGKFVYGFDKCKEISLQYTNKRDFRKNHKQIYHSAYHNGWLDEICSHMELLGNEFFRLIYIFEFEDNNVYIGLTCDSKRRQHSHLKDKKSQVYRHMKKTLLNPKYKELTEYIEASKASQLEISFIDLYKKNGFNLLNKAKGGGLGTANLIWTYEKCRDEALKYTTRKTFQLNSGSAYRSACQNKWLTDICLHMVYIKKIKNYWTYENCKNEALKYKTRGEFSKKANSAYRVSRVNEWLNIFFPFMEN